MTDQPEGSRLTRGQGIPDATIADRRKRRLNLGAGDETFGDVRVDRYRHGTTTLLADVDRGLPFSDNLFDEVYSRSLFEHLKDPYRALLEMRRVCKPGGRITIITDNAGYPTHYIKAVYGDHVGCYTAGVHGPEDRHFAIFTREHLRNFAVTAHLDILELALSDGAKGRSVLTRILRRLQFAKDMAYPWVRLVAQKPP